MRYRVAGWRIAQGDQWSKSERALKLNELRRLMDIETFCPLIIFQECPLGRNLNLKLRGIMFVKHVLRFNRGLWALPFFPQWMRKCFHSVHSKVEAYCFFSDCIIVAVPQITGQEELIPWKIIDRRTEIILGCDSIMIAKIGNNLHQTMITNVGCRDDNETASRI